MCCDSLMWAELNPRCVVFFCSVSSSPQLSYSQGAPQPISTYFCYTISSCQLSLCEGAPQPSVTRSFSFEHVLSLNYLSVKVLFVDLVQHVFFLLSVLSVNSSFFVEVLLGLLRQHRRSHPKLHITGKYIINAVARLLEKVIRLPCVWPWALVYITFTN